MFIKKIRAISKDRKTDYGICYYYYKNYRKDGKIRTKYLGRATKEEHDLYQKLRKEKLKKTGSK